VITTPIGNIRTTWPSLVTSNGTEADEWNRATKVPENSPGTEPTASDKILVVEPDTLTDHDQALVTIDAKQSQMTRTNESDWGNATMDKKLGIEHTETEEQK
jgi:hypothetical protein